MIVTREVAEFVAGCYANLPKEGIAASFDVSRDRAGYVVVGRLLKVSNMKTRQWEFRVTTQQLLSGNFKFGSHNQVLEALRELERVAPDAEPSEREAVDE